MEEIRQSESGNAGYRTAGLSRLRILATVGVVCLHTFSMIADNRKAYALTKAQLHFFKAGHLVWRWTVPAFFMITGALLLKPERRTDYRICIGRYCKRVFLALVLFGLSFAAIMQFLEGVRGVDLILNSVRAVLEGESFEHLWYLYTLIGLYLILPILKAFTDGASTRELEYGLGALFLFLMVFPTVKALAGLNIAFVIPVGYPIFYLLAGHYLAYRTARKAGWPTWCGIVLITAVLIHIAYTAHRTSMWTHYDNALIAIEAMLFFHAFRGMDRACGDRLWSVDRLCFAVYLVHPVFIHFSYEFLKITPCSAGDAYALAAIGFCALFTGCSFAASWLLNRIGPLRRHVL